MSSFKINAKSALKERSAALNTQLRFGRERPALLHAYQLRTFLQLRGGRDEDEQRELERVEKVIVELERRKTSGIQKLIKSIIETARASLTPDVDDETTLLDKFRTQHPADDPELDDEETRNDPLVEREAAFEADDFDDSTEYDDAESLFEPAPDIPEEKPVEADGWGWGADTSADADSWSSGRWTSPVAAEAKAPEAKAAEGKAPAPRAPEPKAPEHQSKPGAETTASDGPAGASPPAGDDHWGGSEGYSYDDKF